MFRLAAGVIFLSILSAGTSVAQQERLQDPMRPYRASPEIGGQAAVARPLQLSAVLLSPRRRIAVIDGKLYREGDRVRDATIIHIETGLVRLQRGDQSVELRIFRKSTGRRTQQGDSGS